MPSVESPPKNLILIGFMGCGKTTIGRELGKLLGYPVVDTDQLIESKVGLPIPRIFAERGEDHFRLLESAVLQELSAPGADRRIISTGGGIVTRKRNRRLLARLGFVVWLQIPAEEVLRRTAANRQRPLLETDDRERKIRDLLAEREPLYRETAHCVIETTGLDASEVACGILETARYHFAQNLP